MKILARLPALAAALLLLPSIVFAQTAVTGHVLDTETRSPLPGVTVLAEGTTLGTVTDQEGGFTLDLPPSVQNLVFSYVGYESETVKLSSTSRPLRVELRPRLMDLQPMIVSASRQEEKRTDAPVAVSAISAAQLQATKPNMLYEALNTVPGVHMTNLGNEQHNMSIRQPLSYGALYAYLEDGIPIRPTGIFNHNALTEINMAGVERIEVVRGPSSSLFGANAVGGAINFITPTPTPTLSGHVRVRGDDYGYRRGDYEASTTAGRLGLYGGGYVARQRHGWADHSDFDKLSLTLRGDYAFAPATRLTTTFSTNHLNTDTNGNLDSLNFYRKGYTSLQTFTYRKVDATRLTTRLDQVWNAHSSTNLAVFWRNNSVGQLPHYRIKNIRNDPAHASGEVNDGSFWSLGVNIQHRQYFDWLDARLIAGATLDRSPDSFVAHYLQIERDPATGRYLRFQRLDSLLTDYRVNLLNAAGYTQFELSPVTRLKLVASLRFDHIAYGFDNHLPPSAFSGAPDGRNTYDRFSPRVGATYDFGKGRGTYANYSRGFLPPEVSELYRGVTIPTLQPSTFDSYEAGGWAALLDGRLNAEASVYRMNGTNEVISVRLAD
ncbi:MAG TPA: TonB-dependent receptor, partial [Rhodothermales bacterium]|nr:TonB-dependent receptor [Rhodothermales bacterium]